MDPLLAGITVFIITFIILLIFTSLFASYFGVDSRPGFDGSTQDR